MSIVLGLDDIFQAQLHCERNKTVKNYYCLLLVNTLLAFQYLEKKINSPVYHGLVLTLNINDMFLLNLHPVRKAKTLSFPLRERHLPQN